MAKQIMFDESARHTASHGVSKLARVVTATLARLLTPWLAF